MIYPNSKMFLPIFKNNSGPQPGPDYSTMPLTFRGLSSTNAFSIYSYIYVAPDHVPNLSYRKNGGEWTSYYIGSSDKYQYAIITFNKGDIIELSGANTIFSDRQMRYKFRMSGLIEAKGNIQSLLNNSSSIVSDSYVFAGLFAGCSSLVKAPLLPATEIGSYCYVNMFEGTSITTAPQLPATTLKYGCYEGMFVNCKKLTAAPQLPATILTAGCYQSMFYGCSNLSSISVEFSDWTQATNATTNWVSGVAANGTFTKPTALAEQYGTSRIPVDNETKWTVINK